MISIYLDYLSFSNQSYKCYFFSESAYFRYIFNNIIFLGISLQYFNLCCNSSLFNSCDWLVVSSFFFFKSYSKKVDFIKKWLVTYSHYAVNITLLPTQNYFQRQIENKRNIRPSLFKTQLGKFYKKNTRLLLELVVHPPGSHPGTQHRSPDPPPTSGPGTQ